MNKFTLFALITFAVTCLANLLTEEKENQNLAWEPIETMQAAWEPIQAAWEPIQAAWEPIQATSQSQDQTTNDWEPIE